ncbi:MAG: CtsR family transcriptional regulator [Oscillospiraceae bacterium]|nr:CtsR family transcriptional regulator [Oscillospiraceae bacterium]
MKISDNIESFIKGLMDETGGQTEIQRNELAIRFGCVPSQINYVISTRFSNGQGYIVESRRGGGGGIRIRRAGHGPAGGYLMHIITSMGVSITQQCAGIFIRNFLDYGAINEREAALLYAAVNDKALAVAPKGLRDELRAGILKSMMACMTHGDSR